MKRIVLLVICLVLAISAAAAAEENLFDTLSGIDWSFSSGVGGWYTELQIRADGSFTGSFHDSEMGEYADEYPDGTVYFCAFSGQMSLAEQVSENTWKIRVEKLEKEQGVEEIADGIHYVPADVYGISEGDEMVLYRPGTPASVLTEEMRLWAHVSEQETSQTELENWFLSSEKNDSGFVGYAPVPLANPWEDTTAEQLASETGLSFGVPEGAENVIYRYLRSDETAEMQFSWEGGEFCARIRPMVLEDWSFYDISGMYYEWKTEEPVNVGPCTGSLSQAMQDDGVWVERCLWYDADAKRMYSLSVTAEDVDGLDLTALAEQVYNR